ncbi:unnamed protein product [Aspergillus oryzae]|uniref:Unnamed protein product n=2 Tax=Aspergillus oryzae TaxID=5062 RepID=A0AAN4YFZ5_ASPOZ|nr:unnamed protein product [Aspergillus oryzae]GMF89176.1 unnamed protein product [Aspergillus oryzae]GMG02939.1 unnamed protein product [Aspergillus oryzae]GMG25762.1 unnamed protein product [Aspergillus oryzae]GMG48890.1 unnamed protein product [Aspergillus oryzae var. brunneus]
MYDEGVRDASGNIPRLLLNSLVQEERPFDKKSLKVLATGQSMCVSICGFTGSAMVGGDGCHWHRLTLGGQVRRGPRESNQERPTPRATELIGWAKVMVDSR